MGRRKIWDEEKLEEFKKLYSDERRSVDYISQYFNISIKSVYKIACKYNLRRCRPKDEERKKRIKRILLKATGVYLD